MSAVDAICLVFAILSGMFMAAMPAADNPKPPVYPGLGLGASLAGLFLFLAMSTLGAFFPQTMVMSLVVGIGGFFLVRPMFKTQEALLKPPADKDRDMVTAGKQRTQAV